MKVERLKRIVVHRLIENINAMWDKQIGTPMHICQKYHDQQDLNNSLKTGGKKINEICYRIFTGFPTNVYEIDRCLETVPSEIWSRYTMILTDDIAQYYENKDNVKPWMKNNKILQRNTSVEDFISEAYNSDDDFIILAEELQSNYPIVRNFQNVEYNILVYFTNIILEDLEKEANLNSKKRKITKEAYLEILYMKISRMNQKKA